MLEIYFNAAGAAPKVVLVIGMNLSELDRNHGLKHLGAPLNWLLNLHRLINLSEHRIAILLDFGYILQKFHILLLLFLFPSVQLQDFLENYMDVHPQPLTDFRMQFQSRLEQVLVIFAKSLFRRSRDKLSACFDHKLMA